MSGYVKLYGSILTSSVWMEPHHVVRVWITMLATADKRGRVEASIPGLANQARVTVAECIEALELFKAPDPFSRTKTDDGRRIEEVDGGWLLLNHEKYRELRTESQVEWAAKKKHWRDQNKPPSDMSEDMRGTSEDKQIASSSASSSAAVPSTHPPAIKNFLAALPGNQSVGHWSAIIAGWQQGLGFEGGKAATPEDIATGLTEYLATEKRDFAVIHVRSFVERAYRNRLKSAARPNGKASEDASRLWQLLKTRGIHHMTSATELDRELASLVTAGTVLNANEFKTMLGKLDLKVLRKAEQDSFAIRHISERLNGSLVRVLA